MRFETLSVFPQVFAPYLDESIMGRAQRKGILDFEAYDLRHWTHDRHNTVDDAPFGGGQGMLMKPAPIFEAVRDIASRGDAKPHVVFFSPCGRRYDESCAQRLATLDRVLLVCGRYEGMDERAYELADEVFSLGDYVLTGGELAALVVIDSVVRLLPGALGDEKSAEGTRSTRARRTSREGAFRTCCSPATTAPWTRGAGEAQSSARPAGARTCWTERP